jgi:hypothetical protein
MRGSGGFSLVEVLVAAFLLALGVLAVTASTVAARRLADLGAALSRSADEAASRLAAIGAAPCVATGGETAGRYATTWSVGTGDPLVAADVAVSFTGPGGQGRVVRVGAGFLCAERLP